MLSLNGLSKCLHWPFYPGVFIAVLAVLASAATYLEKPSRWAKVLIIALFTVIMCAEIWMMGKDRDQHDQEQARIAKSEADHFQAIADDMKRDFDATMARLEAHSVSLDKLEKRNILVAADF